MTQLKFPILLISIFANINCQNTFNVSVWIRSVCLNIYDAHYEKYDDATSQLRLKYFALSGNQFHGDVHYSLTYPYTAQLKSTRLFGVSQSFHLTGLRVEDSLVFVVSVQSFVKRSTKLWEWIKCPDESLNGTVLKIVNPAIELKSARNSSHITHILLSLNDLSNCDKMKQPIPRCKKPGINIQLDFACEGNCSDLLLDQTPIPRTTTALTTTMSSSSPLLNATSTFSSPNTPWPSVSPSDGATTATEMPQKPGDYFSSTIAILVVALIELSIIGIGIFMNVRLRKSLAKYEEEASKPSVEFNNSSASKTEDISNAAINKGSQNKQPLPTSAVDNPTYGVEVPDNDMANNELYG